MKINGESLPLVQETFKQILEKPESIFELMRIDIKDICERALSDMIRMELEHFLGREKYKRQSCDVENRNYYNGSYERKYTVKNLGELNVKVARDRKGEFQTGILEKYKRYESTLENDIVLMFLNGLSTRSISLISKKLLGRKISASEVSHCNKELLTGIDAWRQRDLSTLDIKYMYIDGVNFHMRVDKNIQILPMLVIIGVTYSNQKVFLTIQQGDKESASTWREVFKDLKKRGLNKDLIQLGIMDGLKGLETVFKQEFHNAKVQRCQVHIDRNVLTKVPKKLKQEVADKLRDIFYAKSKSKAMENYKSFVSRYQDKIPSAVKSLTNSIDSALTFYAFPEDEWISLRTTNLIERVNKEFKRRTKPMEILAGEESAYRLLCFIALKMELNWRHAPLGRNNLPVLKKFTQKT